MARITKRCQNVVCGDEFEVELYDHNRGIGLYCSESCSHQAQRVEVPSKDELSAAYEQGLSTNDLAEKFNVSKGTIYNLFKTYELEARSLSEANDVASRTHKMGGYGNIKGGSRVDLGGLHVRSLWEANVARWFNLENIAWEYEPERFYFPIKRGVKSYSPDFWLPERENWVEVKGHIPKQDKTRMKRFKRHCPDEFKKLVVIVANPRVEAALFFEELDVPVLAYYNDIKKRKQEISHWDE